MIFTGEHYYLGLIQAALIVVHILLGVFVAGKNRCFDRLVVWVIGAYLLFYKMWEYGPFETLPLDLSAMSYFLFGFAAFIPFRPLKTAASFSAMLSGVVYAVTMTLYPESHIGILHTSNRYFLVAMAMANHNLMFAGGLFMSSRHRFFRTDYVWVFGWLAFFFGYVILLIYGYGADLRTSSIVQIMQGTLVADVLGLEMTAAYYVVYYIIFFSLFGAVVWLYGLLNRAYHKKDPPYLPPPRALPEFFA